MKTSLSNNLLKLAHALHKDGFKLILLSSSCIVFKKNRLTIKIK